MSANDTALLINAALASGLLVKSSRSWRWWRFSIARVEMTDGSLDWGVAVFLPKRFQLIATIKRWPQ
jgi:hypothetical protein